MAVLSDRKAVEYAVELAVFCRQQRSCQDCIFRLPKRKGWSCNLDHIEYIDMREIWRNTRCL